MSFRLVPKSVTLNDLEPHNAWQLSYYTECVIVFKANSVKHVCFGNMVQII